jgi:hypothetical protein
VSTTVRIALAACLPSLVACYQLSAQVQQDAIALRERLPALWLPGPKGRTPLDMGVYTEGTYLPVLGAHDCTTAQVLTAYVAHPFPSSLTAGDHLVTVVPRDCPKLVSAGSSMVPRHRTVATEPMRPFTAAERIDYAHFLNNWGVVPAVFGGQVCVRDVMCRNGLAHVALDCAACPFGGGCDHEVHLIANDAKRTARAVCMHRACAGRELRINDAGVSQTDALDRVYTQTLHTQAAGVAWSDRYCEPAMRPLPIAGIVCVRAQMGLGKTKAVVEHLRATCTPATSVLVVSFSISLCKQLNAALADGTGLDFTLYLDTQGDLGADRATVCLDSLLRCVRRSYDVLVLDEAHSVLAHFNSPHMRESGLVAHKLERLLVGAGRVLLVDAVCDSTLVKLVVDRMEAMHGESAVWVRNDYVRKTNRLMQLQVAEPRVCL